MTTTFRPDAQPSPRSDATPASKRGRPSLRTNLATRLIGITLLATLLLGGIIYFETRSLLTNAIETQLVNQQRSQARVIESGLDSVTDMVSVVARDESTAQALTDFAAAFTALNASMDLLNADERNRLDTFYTGTIGPTVAAAGLELSTSEGLVPASRAAQYLQYHYVVANPYEPAERYELATAEGDTSGYARVHSQHHPLIYGTWVEGLFSDLLLVDADGTIVYSAQKRPDLGRNLDSHFLGEGFGDEISRNLAGAALGEAVLVDYRQYPAAAGAPTLFAAAAVSGPQGSIGAVVVEIPIETLNRLTTVEGEWSRAGLGETGEVYVVGRDRLLRSDSRLWLEDEAAYLEAIAAEGYPPELAEAISQFDTTVLQQPVDAEAVEVALDGERFLGRVRDYLGRDALASAERIDSDQLDWVVVAEVDTSETGRSLSSYVRRLLFTAAILVPLVGLFGVVLAGRFTRPFAPVRAAAERVAGGDLDVDIPDLGRNELGDVARRLTDLAAFLRDQETAIAAEEDETRRLLLSALPPRIVARFGTRGEDVDDLVDSATVVAVTVRGLVETSSIDPETSAELAATVSRELEAVAERLGLERLRSSSDQHIFVSGLDRPSADTELAAAFAVEIRFVLDRFTDETGVDIEYHVGVCSGQVISGLIGSDQITYGVFGEPPKFALALAAIADAGQVLVDERTSRELGAEWELEAASNLCDLRGQPINARVLLGSSAGDSAAGQGREGSFDAS